jgi:acetoacetyl-CoA synthetase
MSNPILWSPSEVHLESALLTKFAKTDNHADYAALHESSIARPAAFWSKVWHECGVIGEMGDPSEVILPGKRMIDAKWFPGASLNFAENLLRPADLADAAFADSPAIIFHDEQGREEILSRREVLKQATAFGQRLRDAGIEPGDRVAAILPNTPIAIIAMLGASAIGAIWSSCSPDFGDDAICDRFCQIRPRVLVTLETCTYAGKSIALKEKTKNILSRLPSVEHLYIAGAGDDALSGGSSPRCERFEAVTAMAPEVFEWRRFPFNHPLYILYSSGTTGAPKCIVHGAGGTLLQHLKEHQLHSDIRPGDRVFYYTSTGWMMWNWLASALASKATIILFDGSPLTPDPLVLFRMAEKHRVTQFGASAKYYATLDKQSIKPREACDLSSLRCILSTGSPLLPETFDYIYREIKQDVNVASISGGTDIISCFVLGCPTLPVRRGEIQVKGLGMDVEVWNENGERIINQPGELVCKTPFPSMPIYFWNDPNNEKYLASYFSTFENVWRHGDWAQETESGGMIIYGRSDTTLNPGGVRIGTSEIYQQVETFPEIAESVATAFRAAGDEQIILFVRMQPGKELSAKLIAEIRQRLRERCSPRHAPAHVVAANDFPRTRSGKVSEIAIRDLLSGIEPKNVNALANPESLDFFRTWKPS